MMSVDTVAVWDIRTYKAKKDWQCECCYKPIPAGTTYTCYAWVFDGSAGNDRYHPRCAELMMELRDLDGRVALGGTSLREAIEWTECITEKARELLEEIFGQQRAFELLGQRLVDEDTATDEADDD